MLRWILFVIIYASLSIYVLQALKTVARQPWVYYIYMAIAVAVAFNFIYQFTAGEESGRVLSVAKSYAFGFLLAILTFKLILFFFFPRIFLGCFSVDMKSFLVRLDPLHCHSAGDF
jgi:hypothetical protein